MFAARRLEGEPVALVFALRPGEGGALDLTGVEQLAVAGLGPADVAVLLGLPVALADQLHAATHGNPLALLEARETLTPAQFSGRDSLADPFPVGPAVQAAFRRRLERLPERTRLALTLVAAAGAEALDEIAAAAADLHITLSDLAPAETAGLVTLDVTDVRFRHPLVRAAAYADAPAPDRRSVHAALAGHTDGPRRAGHLWAAASGPDAVAAAALEAAAGEARARTGYDAAALFGERAGRLSVEPGARARRLAGAAQDRLMSGDVARAAALAGEAMEEADSAVAVDMLGLLGSIDLIAGSLDDGYRRLSEAADQVAAEDPARGAWLLATAAMAFYMGGHAPSALETTERAYALAQRAGDRIEAVVGILLGGGRIIAGLDDGDGQRALLDRWPDAIDESVLIPAAPHLTGALQFLGWVERYDEAEEFAGRVERMAREFGAGGALPVLLGRLEIDLRRGAWADARVRTSAALRLADASGQRMQKALPMTVVARLDAAMGLEAECRATVDELFSLAAHSGMGPMRVYGLAALGLLELGLGRSGTAVEHLDEAERICVALGQRDPSIVPFAPDRIEALVREGDEERAEAVLADFEAMARRVRRAWPTAAAARCRGLLARRLRSVVRAGVCRTRPAGVAVRARADGALSRRAAAAGTARARGA